MKVRLVELPIQVDEGSHPRLKNRIYKQHKKWNHRLNRKLWFWEYKLKNLKKKLVSVELGKK